VTVLGVVITVTACGKTSRIRIAQNNLNPFVYQVLRHEHNDDEGYGMNTTESVRDGIRCKTTMFRTKLFDSSLEPKLSTISRY
jgi:hypothetical protein